MEQSVPKRWHIKFRCWGITQKKAYNFLFMSCQTDVLPAYVTKLLSFPDHFGSKVEGSQLLETTTVCPCLPNRKFCTVSLFLRREVQAVRISLDQYSHGFIYLACWYLKQSANWVCSRTSTFSLYPSGMGVDILVHRCRRCIIWIEKDTIMK